MPAIPYCKFLSFYEYLINSEIRYEFFESFVTYLHTRSIASSGNTFQN